MQKKTVSLSGVWLLLLAATILATLLGHHSAGPLVKLPPIAAATVLLIAFVKVGLIMAYFMELKRAPYLLVIVAAGWISVECGLLLWLFSR